MSAPRVLVLVLDRERIAGPGLTGRIAWRLEYRGELPEHGPVVWRGGAAVRMSVVLWQVRRMMLEARAAGWRVVAGRAL